MQFAWQYLDFGHILPHIAGKTVVLHKISNAVLSFSAFIKPGISFPSGHPDVEHGLFLQFKQ